MSIPVALSWTAFGFSIAVVAERNRVSRIFLTFGWNSHVGVLVASEVRVAALLALGIRNLWVVPAALTARQGR